MMKRDSNQTSGVYLFLAGVLWVLFLIDLYLFVDMLLRG